MYAMVRALIAGVSRSWIEAQFGVWREVFKMSRRRTELPLEGRQLAALGKVMGRARNQSKRKPTRPLVEHGTKTPSSSVATMQWNMRWMIDGRRGAERLDVWGLQNISQMRHEVDTVCSTTDIKCIHERAGEVTNATQINAGRTS